MSGDPGSCGTPSCRQWHHGGCAPCCSGPHWSTSLPSASHIAKSCSQWARAGQAPAAGLPGHISVGRQCRIMLSVGAGQRPGHASGVWHPLLQHENNIKIIATLVICSQAVRPHIGMAAFLVQCMQQGSAFRALPQYACSGCSSAAAAVQRNSSTKFLSAKNARS